MTLASRMSGLACAMQVQEEARPNRDCAIFESVSPLRIVILVEALLDSAGRKICEPATMRFASTIPGLAASSSGQRTPLPRFSCAIFHKESPGLTINKFTFGCAAGLTAVAGFAGLTTMICGSAGTDLTTGAAGCEGATRMLDGSAGLP